MDFKEMIKAAQAQGRSIEDIAKEFTESINEVEKEQEQKCKWGDDRFKLISSWDSSLIKHSQDGTLTLKHAAMIMASLYALNNEHGLEASAEEIEDYYNFIIDVLNGAEMGYELKQKIVDKVTSVADKAREVKKTDFDIISDFLDSLF